MMWGDYIWREKFRGEWAYITSDFEVDNTTAVQIWEMNDGRYFLQWKTVANTGYNVFETSSEAERELEFIVKEIKDPVL